MLTYAGGELVLVLDLNLPNNSRFKFQFFIVIEADAKDHIYLKIIYLTRCYLLAFFIWNGESYYTSFLWISFAVLRCTTSAFVNASRQCQALRVQELMRRKVFYRISDPEKRNGILHLDQPRMRTLSYYLTEKFHSQWFNLYFTLMLQKSNSLIVPYFLMKYRRKKFTSYDNYAQLAKDMKDILLVRSFILMLYNCLWKNALYCLSSVLYILFHTFFIGSLLLISFPTLSV